MVHHLENFIYDNGTMGQWPEEEVSLFHRLTQLRIKGLSLTKNKLEHKLACSCTHLFWMSATDPHK